MENPEEGEGEGRSKRQRLEEEEALIHEDNGAKMECEGSRGLHGRHGAGAGDGVSEAVRLPANRFGVQCLRARDKIHAVERDYSHHYIIGVGGEAGSDQIVFQHFNKLCLIGLAPSHASMANGRRIVEVDFEVGRAGDKSGRVSGKKKIGAAHLIEDSRLCDVISSDGSRFRVRSCIRGHLLELNERLKVEPGLLNDKTTTEGYIAIVNPRRDEEDTVCDAFLSKEQYMSRLADMAATDQAKKICKE